MYNCKCVKEVFQFKSLVNVPSHFRAYILKMNKFKETNSSHTYLAQHRTIRSSKSINKGRNPTSQFSTSFFMEVCFRFGDR